MQTLLSASLIQGRFGNKVTVLDAFAEDLSQEHIFQLPSFLSAKVICIPHVLMNRECDDQVVQAWCAGVKERFPEKTLVLYGPAPFPFAQDSWHTRVDYWIVGDFEYIFPDFAKQLNEKGECVGQPGVMRVLPESLPSKMDAHHVADLDLDFFTDFSLVDMGLYRGMPHRQRAGERYDMEIAKGCYNSQCLFCDEGKRNPGLRARSPQNVVDEIKIAYFRGFREFQFNNPQMPASIEWATEFARLVRENNLDIQWSGLSRVDRLTPEIARAYKDSGCYNLLLGIESIRDDILKFLRKGQTLKSIERGVRVAKDAGLTVTASYLIGIPQEGLWDGLRLMRFSIKNRIDFVQLFLAKWPDAFTPAHGPRGGDFATQWDYTRFDFLGRPFTPHAYRSLAVMKWMRRLSYFYFYFHPITVFRMLGKIEGWSDFVRMVTGVKILVWMGLGYDHRR